MCVVVAVFTTSKEHTHYRKTHFPLKTDPISSFPPLPLRSSSSSSNSTLWPRGLVGSLATKTHLHIRTAFEAKAYSPLMRDVGGSALPTSSAWQFGWQDSELSCNFLKLKLIHELGGGWMINVLLRMRRSRIIGGPS